MGCLSLFSKIFRRVFVHMLLDAYLSATVWAQVHFFSDCKHQARQVTKATMSVLLEHGYKPDYYDLWRVLHSVSISHWSALASGKKVFEGMGFRHISLDINGEDGAISLDLSRPLNASLLYLQGKCDIVTNFGTTEHVGESEYLEEHERLNRMDVWTSQYHAFRNIHSLARNDGGIIINMVPAAGCWPLHGAVEYEPRFFHALAQMARYDVRNLSLHRPDHDWSAQEEQLFWKLLREALAKHSLQLPDYVNPDELPARRHQDKEEQANVLSIFVRRGPHLFPDVGKFLQSPGLHIKRKLDRGLHAFRFPFLLHERACAP